MPETNFLLEVIEEQEEGIENSIHYYRNCLIDLNNQYLNKDIDVGTLSNLGNAMAKKIEAYKELLKLLNLDKLKKDLQVKNQTKAIELNKESL